MDFGIPVGSLPSKINSTIWQAVIYNKVMMQMTVDDFKAQFSSILEKVINGDEVQILYGRAKKPVATLTHIEEKPKKKRIPGLYKDYGPYWEDETFRLTPEWLFDDMDDLMR